MNNEYSVNDIQTKINQNQCTHPDPDKCPNYMELFHVCTKPSVSCSYRKHIVNQNIKHT